MTIKLIHYFIKVWGKKLYYNPLKIGLYLSEDIMTCDYDYKTLWYIIVKYVIEFKSLRTWSITQESQFKKMQRQAFL